VDSAVSEVEEAGGRADTKSHSRHAGLEKNKVWQCTNRSRRPGGKGDLEGLFIKRSIFVGGEPTEVGDTIRNSGHKGIMADRVKTQSYLAGADV